MNKKFLSAILFGALMVTSTGTFVSCKDYEDDIKDVQEQVDANKAECAAAIKALQDQATALQSALATAQSTADAAKKAAADAQTAADKAAAAAQQAAAEAKEEAIAKALEEVNALKAWVESQNYVTEEGLAEALLPISAKIAAIEETLDQIIVYMQENLEANIQIALKNIMTLQEDLAIQQATLDKYAAILEELGTADEELWAELTSTREELQQAVSALNVLLEEETGALWAELTSTREGLQQAITALNNLVADNYEDLNAEITTTREGLQEALTALNNLVEDLNVADEELWAELTSTREGLQQAITALNNLVADNSAAIEDLQNEVGSIYAAIGQTATNLNNLIEANAAETQAKFDEVWAEIASNNSAVNEAITSVYNQVLDLQGELATLHTLFASQITSLNFIPEAYVDGVEAILFGSYEYNPLTLVQKDSKDETATASNNVCYANPAVIAKYHVSPSTATFDQVKDQLSFALESDSKFITSRGMSQNLAVTPEFVSLENGILTVKVNIEGAPATEEFISVVALQIKNEEGAVVTSDYATIFKQELDDLRIADKKKYAATPKVDYHFRQYINTVDEEAGNDQVVWEHYTDESIDLTFDYKESLDLNEYVGVHALGTETEETVGVCGIADLEALGMTLEYDIVKNYIIGENKTDQMDFVNLADGVLTAKVFDETGAAAIGRTPIVRVRLMDGDNIVKVAYVKVLISKNIPDTENKTFPLVVDDFKFECGEDGVVKTTVEQINKQLYNALDLSKAEFHAMYTFFEDFAAETDLGTVVEKTETIEGETTHILEWTITNEEMWENAGKEVSNVIYYRVAEGSNVFVAVELKSNLEGLKKVYEITKADYIANYWDADKTYTKFNVAVPSSTTDEDPANCTFVNNLNSPFTTWPATSTTGIPGILKLDEAVTGIEYFFCAEDIAQITEIGGIEVEFLVSEDGLTLSASVDEGETYEVVATINNADETWYNVVTYNKESDLAKELLNTGAMYSYIGAKGYVCDDESKPVAITFDGEDHFKANFIRPVNIAEQAADNFIDGVDVGEKGSFIRLEDLIAPYDWRGRYFSEYENYWGYYGPFSIKVLTEEAQCDLNGVMQDVPTTVVLEQSTETVMGDAAKGEQLESEYGFLTYKNNGTNVEEFNVYVKVEVTYGWGVIETGYIKVNVKSTIAAE